MSSAFDAATQKRLAELQADPRDVFGERLDRATPRGWSKPRPRPPGVSTFGAMGPRMRVMLTKLAPEWRGARALADAVGESEWHASRTMARLARRGLAEIETNDEGRVLRARKASGQ